MLTLHYAPDNASLIVRLVLEELGLPYRAVLVDRRSVQQKSPTFRALNPQGLIPVLDTPDGPVWETAAICLWLAEATGRMAPPPGDRQRGDFLKWLFFVSGTLHADLRMQFYPARFAPDPDAARPLTTARLSGHFHLLDDLAAKGPAWFGAGAPSVLDCYVAVAMRWAALYTAGGPRWFQAADHPHLLGMARRLETRATVARAVQAEGLGPTPFSAPRLPDPPEGHAT